MAEVPQKRSFLIVGDTVIDRTWVVSSAPPTSTSQAHFDVAPWKLVEPHRECNVLGGAATIARSVAMLAPGAQVHLAGAWGNELHPGDFVPDEPGFEEAPRIQFHMVANTPFTREITRVYEATADEPVLKARYDRDVSKKDHAYRTWPALSDVSALIVADYNRGLFDLPEVLKQLKTPKSGHLLLRSKRADLRSPIFHTVPWTILCPNRQDFGRWFNLDTPPQKPVLRRIGGEYRLHPAVIRLFFELPESFKKRSLLLKLDREGAILLNKGILTAFALDEANQSDLAAIGAGDVLMASLAAQLTMGVELQEACVHSVKRATAHCQRAARLDELQGWRGIACSVADDKISDVSLTRQHLGKLNDLVKEWKRASSYPSVRNHGIQVHHASWYLRDFLTVNEVLGSDILRLRAEIATYMASEDPKRKPFLAALCGEPGAGKSALAEALGAALDCKAVTSNAAQWVSIEDLFSLCESIRSIRVRGGKALVFIDEVDSKVAGENIYGKLLAPVWDGAYTLRGQAMPLGPAVFLIAGSSEPWKTKSGLLDLGSYGDLRGSKLPDLVSRFTAMPIEVPHLADRRADAVYIAMHQMRKRFPRARSIERGILRFIAESELLHGPRSIVYLVNAIGPLQSEERITCGDLHLSDAQLKIHIKVSRAKKSATQPRWWASDTQEVGIER